MNRIKKNISMKDYKPHFKNALSLFSYIYHLMDVDQLVETELHKLQTQACLDYYNAALS